MTTYTRQFQETVNRSKTWNKLDVVPQNTHTHTQNAWVNINNIYTLRLWEPCDKDANDLALGFRNAGLRALQFQNSFVWGSRHSQHLPHQHPWPQFLFQCGTSPSPQSPICCWDVDVLNNPRFTTPVHPNIQRLYPCLLRAIDSLAFGNLVESNALRTTNQAHEFIRHPFCLRSTLENSIARCTFDRQLDWSTGPRSHKIPN